MRKYTLNFLSEKINSTNTSIYNTEKDYRTKIAR
jgi:hypothetical protein